MRAFWRLSFTVVLTRIWTRIKANGRSLPSATKSSPFSAIRAPSFAATYLTSAGQSRWTLASRFGNGNIDENVGEWHRNSLKWSCQCNSYSALVCSYSRNRSLFLRIYQIVRYLSMTRNENVTTTWPREQGHIPWTKGHRDFKFETSWRKVRNAAIRKNRLSIWNRVGSS